ncbi:hypothetical protein M2451_001746 [Dysgonomonas sp. PFB1-18]|nr:hypothetical protein [Dysgonomonas sp. PF1-14]MDH6338945.1 hypothetical protein [Dysgonomonas sp. PF1-16]MDH6380424.1 hypothetical protein [Dysgonomonas sp. PFB1-18]MDH6397773.1 hypothetical protein [Dysgonomonas sp. PF1-23]
MCGFFYQKAGLLLFNQREFDIKIVCNQLFSKIYGANFVPFVVFLCVLCGKRNKI